MLLKRIFDIILSIVLIILLSPLLLAIFVLIRLDSKGPAVFVQERAGLFGKPFKIYKFRTMVQNAASLGTGYYTAGEDWRITRVGKYLRDWSLDELPQLFNILKGDMSIVGPRPTLMYQIEEYDEEQRKRLHMKPGVTGWAQVNGRNSISWPERIKLDVWYVENWSFQLDVKILFKTLLVVIMRDGVYAAEDKFIVKDAKALYNKDEVNA